MNKDIKWASRYRPNGFALLAGLSATLIAMLVHPYYLSALGVGVFAYSLISYVLALGNDLAIIPVISMVASAQWLVGPYLAYHFGGVTDKFYMYVDEEDYMNFVFPSLLLFIVGMQLLAKRIDCSALGEYLRSKYPIREKTIYILIGVGLFSGLIESHIPGAIYFVFFLLSQVKYIGVIYAIIYRMPRRWLLCGVVYLFGIAQAAAEGLFHDIILWSTLGVSFIFLELRLKTGTKLAIIVLGIAMLTTVQSIKSNYREIIEQHPEAAGVGTLTALMMGSDLSHLTGNQSTQSFGNLNARLNQGWIISAIMAYVPDYLPFENGTTVFEAFRDSLLPRFLFEKREVLASDAFRRYTGLPVGEHTTFGISVVGEAWVNFGYYGILFMFLFGLFYGYFIRLAVLLSS